MLSHQGQSKDALATCATKEDVGQRRALPLIAALVDVEVEMPGRTGLLVVVVIYERRRQPVQHNLVGNARLHQPGEEAEAGPVRGATAGNVGDGPAGADRHAVARLEVRAGDSPRLRPAVHAGTLSRSNATEKPSTISANANAAPAARQLGGNCAFAADFDYRSD